MVERSALLLAFLMIATFSGCLDDSSGFDAGSFDGIPAGQAPSGAGAGTGQTHSTANRTESSVTVTQQGSNYVAQKTVTFRNNFGGAANADVELTTRAGGISARAGGDGGYEIVATLKGQGSTEQAARANLEKLKAVHTDTLSAGRLKLDTEVQFPTTTQGLSGSISAKLPAAPAYRLTAQANAGGIDVEGLGGPLVSLNADAGGLEVSGAFNTASLQADAGGIDLNGIFNQVDASTAAGGISGSIRPTASGTFDLSSDAGGIDLALETGDDQGYDVEADLDAGSISISLPNTNPIGSQTSTHKHVQTAGFLEKPIRTTVTLNTDAGGIDVRGI